MKGQVLAAGRGPAKAVVGLLSAIYSLTSRLCYNKKNVNGTEINK